MHQRIPAKRIAELQNDDKIYLDLSFQSEERWNDTQRRKYVKSLLSNSCPTPIVLADVQSCMKYCEDTYGVDSADYLYQPHEIAAREAEETLYKEYHEKRLESIL